MGVFDGAVEGSSAVKSDRTVVPLLQDVSSRMTLALDNN